MTVKLSDKSDVKLSDLIGTTNQDIPGLIQVMIRIAFLVIREPVIGKRMPGFNPWRTLRF